MVNEIKVFADGIAGVTDGWKTVDDVLVWDQGSGEWKYVLAAKVWTNLPGPGGSGHSHWETMFERVQAPPTSLRADAVSHSSIDLRWDAPAGATGYRVTMSTSGRADETMPVAHGWMTGTTYRWAGLDKDKTYTFKVIAKHTTPNGFNVVSGPSNSITLRTGHPQVSIQNAAYPGTQEIKVTAMESKTWDDERQWHSGNDVEQGYENTAGRNASGAVSYATLYDQLASALGASVADIVEVMDAWIENVYRRPGGGSGTPNVWVHAGNINTYPWYPMKPSRVGANTQFQAPTQNSDKNNFRFADSDWLRQRAQQWADQYAHHNGLVLFRNDGSGNAANGYNGYCIFRGANVNVADWRLVLQIRWQHISVAFVPPSWS